jgi:ATP synthase complex subunit h.
LVSDLYVQNIKQFKPQALSSKDLESAVKAFQLPTAPSIPEAEVSAQAVGEYETSEVETATVSSTGAPVAEEDWFVFEEEAEEHH